MADIIRYYVVEKYGGVYMDADVTPHRSLDPILNLDTKVILCHELDVEWEYMSVGFFAATQNHPLFKLVCKRIKKALLNTKEPHLHTGPKLFGQCVSDVKLEQPCTVLPTKYFYKNMRDTSHIGEYNGEKDYDERFGNHFFSKD
jgi:mannosyltransferase OCH1-like enzyme